MAERTAVYTCVTEGYDRVIPPVAPAPGIDHLLFTDRPDTQVRGWRTRAIDAPPGLHPALRNRYCKILAHRILPDHDRSVYLDANIAITADLRPFLDEAFADGAALAVHAHPGRRTVAEEVEVCLASGRVRDPEALRAEFARYLAAGFPDAPGGLTGNSILARRHHEPSMTEAMEEWWRLVSTQSGRDQISLPYLRWKRDLDDRIIEPHFSIRSPYFWRYPHWATAGPRARLYIALAARSGQGGLYRAGHALLARSYGDKAAI